MPPETPTTGDQRTPGRPAERRAFTIIELVVVIAIIGLLMGAAAFALPRILGDARVSQTKNDMQTVESAIQLYFTREGQYPPNGNLAVLVGPNGYLDKPSAIEDAWGNQYIYYSPSQFRQQDVPWLLQSVGANGLDDDGGGDDIMLAPGFDIEGP